jgi:glutamyl-Q tRNA(Asp) synthetase
MTARMRGRFAPTPSGPLHLGSLVTAVASYLSVKSAGGLWLVRIEDVDAERTQPGMADEILRTLDAFGLYWDEDVVYQSHRLKLYRENIEVLKQKKQAYLCSCSRREIGEGLRVSVDGGAVYPRYCAVAPRFSEKPCAVRLRTEGQTRAFDDRVFGVVSQNVGVDVGDFVIRRADGFFAYHFAVVVDDALQGITEVVRGSDLLLSTPRQLLLQDLLGHKHPSYAHVPLALNLNGEKLSKQTKAPAILSEKASSQLVFCLKFLGQEVPAGLEETRPQEVLNWGVQNWNWDLVPKKLGVVS